ncbi:MAG: response regulator transcription factor [Chloroflexi bacterium]|nr:response regulator transcription factor [Chloroflexota bacterium]
MQTSRVFILANDALARAGLAALLSEQSELEIVGQGAADEEASAQLEMFSPDVIVWDLGWNDAATIERVNELAENIPTLLLMQDDAAINSVQSANARGILRRDARIEKILAAIHALAHGLTVIEPSFIAASLPARGLKDDAPLEELTPREMQVLKLLARGFANKQIASELKISEHTVKFHINAILGKLGAQSRTDAVVRATRAGLIAL